MDRQIESRETNKRVWDKFRHDGLMHLTADLGAMALFYLLLPEWLAMPGFTNVLWLFAGIDSAVQLGRLGKDLVATRRKGESSYD